jgi:hypothetical protein
MAKNKPPQTAAKALRALHELLLGPEPDFSSMPIEEVREYLKNAGVDASLTVKAVQKRVAEARGQQRLREARQQREHLEAKLTARKASSRLGATFNEVMAQVQKLIGPEQARVYARKYERQDPEDLESLLEDLETLKALREPNGEQ